MYGDDWEGTNVFLEDIDDDCDTKSMIADDDDEKEKLELGDEAFKGHILDAGNVAEPLRKCEKFYTFQYFKKFLSVEVIRSSKKKYTQTCIWAKIVTPSWLMMLNRLTINTEKLS